ncbi:hypothetical protein [Streptomyces sp. NPDC047939]|uniref:hypothetical protein n=1 Tax=Streptomyces sp. NPDC047939 TaxID=3155381 RepID=UPI00343767FB
MTEQHIQVRAITAWPKPALRYSGLFREPVFPVEVVAAEEEVEDGPNPEGFTAVKPSPTRAGCN